MFKKLFLTSFTVAVSLFNFSFSETCDYNASPDGTGTECSISNPCSIQTALDMAKNDGKDSTVCLQSGDFKIFSLSYGTHTSVAEDKSLTLIGSKNMDGVPTSVLNMQSSASPISIELCGFDGTNCTVTRSNSIITLKNLKIINSNTGGLSVWLSGSDFYIENIVFDNDKGDSGSSLYIFSQGNSDIKIKKSVFSVSSSRIGGAVYINCQGGSIYLESNIFDNDRSLSTTSTCGTLCIKNQNAETTLVNNIFRKNSSGYTCGAAFIKTNSGTINVVNNTVINNSAVYCGGMCLITSDDTSIINLYNNIFWNNSAEGEGRDIFIDSDNDSNGFGCVVKFFNNSLSCPISLTPSECFKITDADNFSFDLISNISGDPKLTPDGHLQDGSPCINAGTRFVPISLPDTDVDGEGRIQGAEIDIGADETGGSPAGYYRVEVVVSGNGQVTSFPSGIYCGTDCEEDYLSGTPVTLTARALGNYTFDKWGGDCSSCGDNIICDLTVGSDKTCYAYFKSMIEETTPDNEGCCCSFSAKIKLSESGFNVFSLLLIPAFILFRKILRKK